MKKFFSTLFAVAIIAPVCAADWVSVNDKIFIDKESVQKDGHFVQFTTRQFNTIANDDIFQNVSTVCLSGLLKGFDIDTPDAMNVKINGEEISVPKGNPLYDACSAACAIASPMQ